MWLVGGRLEGNGGKLLSGIKSMYVDSLACIRVKGGESKWFRIDIGVRQGCIMSHWHFNGRSGGEDGDVMEGSGDCLASCMQITWFCVVSRRRN